MRAILIQQGLDFAIKEEQDQEEDSKEKIQNLAKAQSTIILCLGDVPLREVSKEESAAAMWNKLESLYMTKSLANRLYMKQKLYSFKIHDDRHISEKIDEFTKIIDDLENIDVKLEEEDKALILLNSLPRLYEIFRDTLLYGREKTISLEEVQSAIKAKELQRGTHPIGSVQGESLNVRGRSDKRQFRKTKDHINDRARSKSQTRYKCFLCHKEGHFKRNCPERFNKRKESSSYDGEASVASDGYESAEALTISSNQNPEDWILDSGCTFHMCPMKSWFESIQESDQGLVILGNDKACKVKGIGSIRLRMHDGSSNILQQVRYVPELKRNLISLGTLESIGYSFKSENGIMKVLKGSLVVMKAMRKNSLYILLGNTILGGAASVEKHVDKTLIWHQRLGHICENPDFLKLVS